MGKLNVAPTKSNQISLKSELATARDGFNLLDQKREILIIELMRLLNDGKELLERFKFVQSKAYRASKMAIASIGHHKSKSISCGAQYNHNIITETIVKAGVRIPKVSASIASPSAQYAFFETNSFVDDTMKTHLELLDILSKKAELENSIWILAGELKKTQRRVNALEQILLPDFEQTLKYITESLESKELEAFSIMKMVKKRLGNTGRRNN